MNARIGILLLALPVLASAQAMVEYSLGAGRAAVTAVPAKKAGEGIAGAFDNVNRAIQSPVLRTRLPAPRAVAPARPAPRRANAPPGRHSQKVGPPLIVNPTEASVSDAIEPRPRPALEDPSGIQETMAYDEILHRFGPPSLKWTTDPGEEMLSYARNGFVVNVLLLKGKAADVQKAGGSGQAATILQ